MQYSVGLILNLSKQYEECIRYVTDVLKDKKLSSKKRVQLLILLKAAYFNSEKYEKARQTIALALKEPDLSEGQEIQLRLSLAAYWLMKGQAGLSKAIPELNRSFTALQKRGNVEAVVYCLHSYFRMLSLNKEGLDFWYHWKEQIGDEEVFYHLEAEPEDEMMNDAFFTAIIDSPDVKRNVSRLMDAYKIALERKDYMAAGETAEKLGMQYRRAEPVKCAACYLDGAKAYQQAGVPEKMTACAVNALDALIRRGQVADFGLYQQALQYLDGPCGKVADLWVKVAEMLSDPGYEDEPLPMLKEILSGYKDCKRLVLVCLSDLSVMITKALSVSEIHELADAAMAAGVPELIVMRLIHAVAGEMFTQREAVFGERRIAEIKEKDSGFASVIAASPYFELAGGMNHREIFGDDEGMMGGAQYVVRPRFKCRHLDHIWATVARFPGDEDYQLLCITDVVFKSMPEALEEEVQEWVVRYQSQIPDHCELMLQPNKMVRCMALIDGNGLLGKTTAYVEHTRQLYEIIKAMDALAGRYSD